MIDSVQLFKLLADETRLRILILLTRGELCVCDIMTIIGATQSKTSRHLAYLRNIGMAEDRREGLWMHYSLAGPTGALHGRVLEWLKHAEAEVPHALDDLRALREIQKRGKACAARAPVRPLGSPVYQEVARS